jgi:hypothetical protein
MGQNALWRSDPFQILDRSGTLQVLTAVLCPFQKVVRRPRSNTGVMAYNQDKYTYVYCPGWSPTLSSLGQPYRYQLLLRSKSADMQLLPKHYLSHGRDIFDLPPFPMLLCL